MERLNLKTLRSSNILKDWNIKDTQDSENHI